MLTLCLLFTCVNTMGSGEQGKMEKTGCKIICGAPTTLAVKELMMMVMMIITYNYFIFGEVYGVFT